jgi:hypothetical protein
LKVDDGQLVKLLSLISGKNLSALKGKGLSKLLIVGGDSGSSNISMSKAPESAPTTAAPESEPDPALEDEDLPVDFDIFGD